MKDTILRNYQQKAVDKAMALYDQPEHGNGFLCGDDVGLGKTIVALKTAELIKKKYNLISVVCPAFLVPKWRREILARCDDNRKYKFAIHAYTDLTNIHILLQAKTVRYDLIVFDEIHYAKGYKAARTIATLGEKGIHTAGEKFLGLSGSFPPNDIGDAYTWLKAVKSPLTPHGYEMFCHEFAEYCKRNQYGLIKPRGFKPNDRWNTHFAPAFIGRDVTDPEVASEMPTGIPIDFVVDIPSAIEKAEIKLFGQILEDPDLIQKAIEAAPSFDAITEFRKMQGLAKVHAVVEYALNAWENGVTKILIFAFHHEIADKIYDALDKKKKPVILITGLNTEPEERDGIVQIENKKEESIIIATIDALREGIDADGFSLTLIAEMDWRAWALKQIQGRTQRGKPRVIRWVYFYFARGVDKMMRTKIKEKTELSKKVRATA